MGSKVPCHDTLTGAWYTPLMGVSSGDTAPLCHPDRDFVHPHDVEMESGEMYSDLKPNIPSRNCIRSLHSSYLCKSLFGCSDNKTKFKNPTVW